MNADTALVHWFVANGLRRPLAHLGCRPAVSPCEFTWGFYLAPWARIRGEVGAANGVSRALRFFVERGVKSPWESGGVGLDDGDGF